MNPNCPRCQSPKTVEGRQFSLIGKTSLNYFQPKYLRLLTNANHIAIKKGNLLACADCGLLWSEVNPADLQKLLAENGNKALKTRLGLSSS